MPGGLQQLPARSGRSSCCKASAEAAIQAGRSNLPQPACNETEFMLHRP